MKKQIAVLIVAALTLLKSNSQTAQCLAWNVPQMYGGGAWSMGYTGYIPDCVLQYQGPDGDSFVMFAPEGGVAFHNSLGYGIHDDGTCGPGHNLTLPTNLPNPANVIAGNGSHLTGLTPMTITAVNTPNNGDMLCFTNNQFMWVPMPAPVTNIVYVYEPRTNYRH